MEFDEVEPKFIAPSLWVPNLFKLLNHALLIPKILFEQFHSSVWPPNLFGSAIAYCVHLM
jgi:hypothetical protein